MSTYIAIYQPPYSGPSYDELIDIPDATYNPAIALSPPSPGGNWLAATPPPGEPGVYMWREGAGFHLATRETKTFSGKTIQHGSGAIAFGPDGSLFVVSEGAASAKYLTVIDPAGGYTTAVHVDLGTTASVGWLTVSADGKLCALVTSASNVLTLVKAPWATAEVKTRTLPGIVLVSAEFDGISTATARPALTISTSIVSTTSAVVSGVLQITTVFRVINTGINPVENVSISNRLASGVSIVSSDASYSVTDGVVTWNLGTITDTLDVTFVAAFA